MFDINDIQKSELVLEYQPQMFPDGSLRGFEALVRVDHPEKGIVYPDTFIPALEKEPVFICDFGLQVIKKSTEFFLKNGLFEDGLVLSINVSPVQIGETFVASVKKILSQLGEYASFIVFEITETTAIFDPAPIKDAMKSLKTLGVRFAIDDFGTGYSSFTSITKLPFSEIKIDKSFMPMEVLSVEHIQGIIGCFIAIGKNMQLSVVAEGIETEAQYKLFQNAKCIIQGYFISKPIGERETVKFCKKQGLLKKRGILSVW
ncbi:EAL domain-containing protein [Hydrogenovibrio marinus]|uniref:EAL domain-containing protein n=1 Tax=Hydrogenovibrio marinus TaxID=28885 RepID=A0A066ZMM8_HYDMR|nr:EAL domain-containing protein [Hydrogenovibrio marinus]KDN94737.1 hypothetical protein EI16_12650 [Hydrogenovibrio marinus]